MRRAISSPEAGPFSTGPDILVLRGEAVWVTELITKAVTCRQESWANLGRSSEETREAGRPSPDTSTAKGFLNSWGLKRYPWCPGRSHPWSCRRCWQGGISASPGPSAAGQLHRGLRTSWEPSTRSSQAQRPARPSAGPAAPPAASVGKFPTCSVPRFLCRWGCRKPPGNVAFTIAISTERSRSQASFLLAPTAGFAGARVTLDAKRPRCWERLKAGGEGGDRG